MAQQLHSFDRLKDRTTLHLVNIVESRGKINVNHYLKGGLDIYPIYQNILWNSSFVKKTPSFTPGPASSKTG